MQYRVKILIVDDHRMTLMILQRILERDGYEVIGAENGFKAIEHLRKEKIHLVITDVNMPKFSGKDLLCQIRREYHNIPVILITATKDVEFAVESMKAGAFDYIVKPISAKKLFLSVRSALKDYVEETVILDKRTLEKIVIDHYEVEEILGEGAMGIVYLVRDMEAIEEQKYALKLFKDSENCSPKKKKTTEVLQSRFIREAMIVSKFNDSRIVDIIKFGFDKILKKNYILMEYVNGHPLDYYIARPKRLNFQKKIDVIYQICQSLAPIHHAKIAHRDLKPANILLTEDIQVKLTDFGIAKVLGTGSGFTNKGELLGSPAYMAPEALVGKPIDHRSDIFSLGIVAYQLLLDCHPFPGDQLASTCYMICHKEPKEPIALNLDISEELSFLLKKMLVKNLEERCPSVEYIMEKLKCTCSFLNDLR